MQYMAGAASMAGAWFIQWPVRPMHTVWPVNGLYGALEDVLLRDQTFAM